MGIPKPVREYVMKRDKGKCRICGKPATQVHHIYTRNSFVPDYLGVPRTQKNNHPFNLVAVCGNCHRMIHDRGVPQDFKDKMIEYNKSVFAMHFDIELERRLKKVLERLRGKELAK